MIYVIEELREIYHPSEGPLKAHLTAIEILEAPGLPQLTGDLLRLTGLHLRKGPHALRLRAKQSCCD